MSDDGGPEDPNALPDLLRARKRRAIGLTRSSRRFGSFPSPDPADRVHTPRGKAVDAYAHFLQVRDGAADVDGVAPQPVKLGDDENVALLHLVEQPGKAPALRGGRRFGHGLRDDPVRLDAEARRLDLHAPEVADEQMAEARPFAEAFPDRGPILSSS